jgi:hypothetical protein
MSTFTLAYPEYDVAATLNYYFPKSKDYSVSIPLSRQQKSYDLILLNTQTRKYLTIQVKSSRTWRPGKQGGLDWYSWINVFDVSKNSSDYYFIYITFPLFDPKTFKPNAKWDKKIMVFSSTEMKSIMPQLKTKKNTPERFFSFGFNQSSKDIFGERGFMTQPKPNYKMNLLENKLGEIKNSLL